jgi:hypothetical protein
MSNCLGFLISGYIDKTGLERLRQDLIYYKKISNDNKFYLFDLTFFNFKKIDDYEKYFQHDNIEYIKIRSIKELKKFIANKNLKIIVGDICRLSELYIFFLLKIFKIKLAIINNRGLVLQSKLDFQNFFSIRYLYIIKKIEIYLYKILIILQACQKIDYYIETSASQIEKLNKGLLISLDKLLNVNLFSPYKKIYRINSKVSDGFDYNLIENIRENSPEKIITIVDSGYDHPDKKMYENLSQKTIKENSLEYYKRLYLFLNEMKNKFNFEINFCKHPRSNYNNDNFSLIEKNFRIIKINTSEQILKSDLIIFTGGSSLINNAILNQKKIIILISNYQNYFKGQIDYLLKSIDLEVINIDNIYETVKQDNFNLNDIINKSNLKTKNYQKFITNNLIFNKLEKSYEQVSKVIFND